MSKWHECQILRQILPTQQIGQYVFRLAPFLSDRTCSSKLCHTVLVGTETETLSSKSQSIVEVENSLISGEKKKPQKIVKTIQLKIRIQVFLQSKQTIQESTQITVISYKLTILSAPKFLKLWKLNVKRQNCYRNSAKPWRRNFQKLTLFACYLKLHTIISAAQRTSTLDCFPSYCDATSLQAQGK